MMRRTSTHDHGRGGSLVIASNRLPVQSDGCGGQRPADGGLVRALEPLADRIDTWTGTWPATEPSPGWSAQRRTRLHPVRLRPDLAERFYNGYANRTLWPWLHEDRSRTERERSWWSAYQQVNMLFSHALARSPRQATVWVHDYHLMLVPRTLRQLRPDLRIGFFLHTPFPAESSALPANERRVLVRGLLGADLIGFQTEADVAHFRRLMGPEIGDLRTEDERGDAGPSLVARPASIDTDRFKALAADPRTRARAAALRAELGGRRIVLGVDRLDYTKAVPARLAGYEQLLRVGLVDSDSVAFVQVAVPTRSEIDAYRNERDGVECIARRINAQFGSADTGSHRAALRLLVGALPVEELVAYYLAADVLVACPRRDGMNLVVKEYCAAHEDGKGVLVLSTGAGAARELDGAVMVCDVTPDSVALAVHHALRLPPDEGARRMRRMHRHVSRYDGHRWAEGMLDEMRARQRDGQSRSSPSPHAHRDRVGSSGRRSTEPSSARARPVGADRA